MHISEQKKRLRSDIQHRIDQLPKGAREAEGRTISRVLLEELPNPVTICAFVPLRSEVDIRLLLKDLSARGDTIFLPVFANEKLTFKKLEDLSNLPIGELNIPEPPKDAELLQGQNIDIVLVPGRAFARNGKRLGRGAGGYDIWIQEYRKHHPETKFWGVCMECQLIDDVPTEEHDEVMDLVVTARGKIDV